MAVIAATLGFFSVVAALVMAIRGREKVRTGANAYERKKNADAKAWNRIYDVAFWTAFVTAAGALTAALLSLGAL